MLSAKYQEQIYAGVLGKIIGVYLGRPVEGWPYEEIIDRFGQIKYYVHDQLGLPLIVADDDISGTFTFFRTVEDTGYNKQLGAQDIGNTWLNYIIEDKTILWWGGLGNSTEHTAYLNLKSGIKAPASGSIAQNGRTLAEQIGAQIFMDAYAMMCPGDPEAATYYVRQAASVSHDGVAVEAACYLGAIEALAFDVRDLNTLFDRCLKYITSDYLKKVIDDVRNICERNENWRDARAQIDELYGYPKFSGPCPMIPNHAMVLASLLKGGDDFHKSISIATSAAWDTDCNAGNVGCVNGIRLGIDAVNSGVDLRGPVADRMYVVSSDGGECVSDAVRETRKIIIAASKLRGLPVDICDKRFAFEFKGSVQGFEKCKYLTGGIQDIRLSNLNEIEPGENGLMVSFKGLADGVCANISTPTFIDYEEGIFGYETEASPILYETQVVHSVVKGYQEENPSIRMYIAYYDSSNKVQKAYSQPFEIKKGLNDLSWKIPPTHGMPIVRLGFEFSSEKRFDDSVSILWVDWKEAPECFSQGGKLTADIWNLKPYASMQFISSAKLFMTSVNHTYILSHPEENGLATIGTDDFTDYRITAQLTLSLHHSGGLVLRSKGHRRYYGLLFENTNTLSIVKVRDDEVQVIKQVPYKYRLDVPYKVSFEAKGNCLSANIDGIDVLNCVDNTEPYSSGGCGFVVSKGTVYVDGVEIGK